MMLKIAPLKLRFSVAAIALAACSAVLMAAPVTVSFQQGVNGYAGTTQFRISNTNGATHDNAYPYLFLLQGAMDKLVYTYSDPISQRYGFLTFSDVFGTGTGQIPLGSTVISAQLDMRVAAGSFSTSPGPFPVARVIRNIPYIDNVPPGNPTATTWDQFWENHGPLLGIDYDRPGAGYIGCSASDTFYSADITPTVQSWAKGGPNYGLIVLGNTNDYVSFVGTYDPTDPTWHPRLTVTYVPNESRTLIFQEGVNDYTGCSMLRVGQDETTLLGSAIDTSTADANLDGGTSVVDPEFDGLIKFDNVFGSGFGQVAPNAQILKAYLTVTTTTRVDVADAARSTGPYAVHRLLTDVDWTDTNPAKPFLWSEFGGDGPTVGVELGAELSRAQGMTYDSRQYFDVTSTVQDWQSGQPNYGLAIKAALGVLDGWKINWTSSGTPATLRPQLIVLVQSKPADFNNDTHVDDTDFAQLIDCADGPAIPYATGCDPADLDQDGDVDSTDFGKFQACYSGALSATPNCAWDTWVPVQ